MVVPLVDEHKPKCYVCHKMFENMEQIKKHHESDHKDFFAKFEEEK